MIRATAHRVHLCLSTRLYRYSLSLVDAFRSTLFILLISSVGKGECCAEKVSLTGHLVSDTSPQAMRLDRHARAVASRARAAPLARPSALMQDNFGSCQRGVRLCQNHEAIARSKREAYLRGGLHEWALGLVGCVIVLTRFSSALRQVQPVRMSITPMK